MIINNNRSMNGNGHKKRDSGETYIEIEVPVRKSDGWLGELMQAMEEGFVPVRWQNGNYHITLAFLKKVPSIEEVIAIMNRHLASFEAPELTFDKIGSFSKSKGGVVFLTCSDVPESVDVPAFSQRLNVCNYKDKEDHRTLHCIQLKTKQS